MLKSVLIFLGSFGVRRFSGSLQPLKEELIKSNLGMLFELYVGRMILLTLTGFATTFIFILAMFLVLGVPLLVSAAGAAITGSALGMVILTIYHSYPFQLLNSKKNSIEGNMPFAINHMAAISASGVPPFVMFKLLTSIPEYGEVSNEAKRIVRNVDTFGMDVVSAMKNVAERTPSQEFKQFLYGIISTAETGGDLKTFLENSAKEALFGYRLKREKYLQTLSTYADFYTAVLIAAPLFFVSVLSVMSLVGGQVFGLSIPSAMRIGVYALIPLMNVAFIMFIHYTQPSM